MRLLTGKRRTECLHEWHVESPEGILLLADSVSTPLFKVKKIKPSCRCMLFRSHVSYVHIACLQGEAAVKHQRVSHGHSLSSQRDMNPVQTRETIVIMRSSTHVAGGYVFENTQDHLLALSRRCSR